MLDMFRDSGFEVHLEPERACVTVPLSLTLPQVVAAAPPGFFTPPRDAHRITMMPGDANAQ